MDSADIDLRNATYRRFVELGRAPSPIEVAEVVAMSERSDRYSGPRAADAGD